MKKKKFLIFPVFLVLAGGLFLKFGGFQNKEQLVQGDQDTVVKEAFLYVGATCSHCKAVEEWLKENEEVKEKSGLVIKEVYYDQGNSQELKIRAKECQISESQGIGVPFLYDRGECVIGDRPIIDYLSVKYQ